MGDYHKSSIKSLKGKGWHLSVLKTWYKMKYLISAQVILAIATFAFYVSGYDLCIIVGLALTNIKDIEADADMIIS